MRIGRLTCYSLGKEMEAYRHSDICNAIDIFL